MYPPEGKQMKDFYKHSHVWLAGSHMYRTNVATSDEDYIGVEFSPQKIVNPFRKQDQTDVKDENVRHSAFKFAQLLVKGNPTIVDLVHHDPIQKQWFVEGLVNAARPYALTSNVLRGYLGYLNEQSRRGFRQQRKHGHRPEEEELGYDPKYIGHCFRLATVLQNVYNTREYYYLSEHEVNHIRSLRSGTHPADEVIPYIEALVGGVTRGINPEVFPSPDKLRQVVENYFYTTLLKRKG